MWLIQSNQAAGTCNNDDRRIRNNAEVDGIQFGFRPGKGTIVVVFLVRRPHHTTTILRPFFRDHPGEPVPEENFWTLRCKGRSTEADTDHPAGHLD